MLLGVPYRTILGDDTMLALPTYEIKDMKDEMESEDM